MPRYLLLIDTTTPTVGLLMGAVEVPPCFSPTDEFLGYCEEMELAVAIQTGEEFLTTWGGPVRPDDLARGKVLLDAMTAMRTADVYVKSTLN